MYFFGTSNAFPAITRTEKRFLFVLDDRCGATVNNADDVDAMVDTCAAAAAVYGTPTYSKMSATCIGQDLSWRKPAAKWEAVLEEMMYNSGYGKKNAVVTPKENLEGARTTAVSQGVRA